jgi:acyl carrier protein
MDANEEALKNGIRQIVSRVLEVDPEKITDEAHFVKDLRADSLMALEILVALEKEYKVKLSEENLKAMLTLKEAVELMRGLLVQQCAVV